MFAAAATGSVWAWLSPVDVPLLDPCLLSILESKKIDGDEAILPVSESGDENLLALVEVEAMIRVLSEVEKIGLMSVSAIYRLLSCRRVDMEILNLSGIKHSCFLNVNHPDDLVRAEKLLTGRQ
jgi:molybdopterin-guanine dinucleotide biosynthesis protein A